MMPVIGHRIVPEQGRQFGVERYIQLFAAMADVEDEGLAAIGVFREFWEPVDAETKGSGRCLFSGDDRPLIGRPAFIETVVVCVDADVLAAVDDAAGQVVQGVFCLYVEPDP